ncbi:MAG: iron ABC transporter substrate-binding protein [Pseudomonadota bacterium]|nr:iron ABC transporter substrate-binding protein [Pseudomonadota bacterium]
MPERITAFRFAAALLYLLFCIGIANAQVVTDSASRTVEIPDKVARVYASGPPASVLLYAVAPDALIGWPRALRPDELPYVAEPYRALPEVGRLTGRGGTANLEVVIREKPDLIVDFGSVRETFISLADTVQKQTGIPYVLIDGRFEATPAALRLLGKALGREDLAERQARYAEALFAGLEAGLRQVPDDRRPRVYLARNADGLESGSIGSINTEIIERAGGRNVVGEIPGRRGLVQMTMEKILAADPEVIITWDRNFYQSVWKDPLWANVAAVRAKRVYLSPTAPFGWIDRPPSLNRLMGLKWLSGVFHPDRFAFDLAAETRSFYDLFYHVKLGDAELERLLKWTRGTPP